VLKKYTAFTYNCILKGPTKLTKESDILLNIHFRIKKGNKISKMKNEKVNGMNNICVERLLSVQRVAVHTLL